MRITTPIGNLFSSKRFKEHRTDRKTGYYWIMWSGRWEKPEQWRIAHWVNGVGWLVTGDDRTFYDSDFCAIDENRIPRVWLAGGETRTGANMRFFILCVAGNALVTAILYLINHIKQ